MRDSLRARAAELPPDASARLRRIDYHPRSRRIRPQLALGAVVGTAGGAGAIAATVALTTATSSAFAGWTPRPTTASRGQIMSAEAACRARIAHPPRPPGSPKPPALASSAPAHLPAELVDTRGPFTFVIFADSHNSASCITGPGFASVLASSTTGSYAVPADQVLASPVTHTSSNGHPYSFAEGNVGADVTAAVLKLTDGRGVQATVAHGWFVAWWPGNSDAVTIEVTTPAGTRTRKLATAPTPPSPGGSVSSSGSSAGSASMSMGGRDGGRGESTFRQSQKVTRRRR